MSKEKRNVEYFLINKELLNNSFSPNDFEIKEYYDANKELFFQNEKRSFIQFNFKNRSEAESFKEKVKYLDTDEIIKYSENNNLRFNNFENLERNEILDNIGVPLFELKVNEQSKIIKSSLANHILILTSIKNSYQSQLEEVSEQIKDTIATIENNNIYDELLNKISEKLQKVRTSKI